MNAKELMIGDWVSVVHSGKPRNVRATFLDEANIGYDVKDEVIVKADKAYNTIPLTAGMLERNGFNYVPRPQPYSSIYTYENIAVSRPTGADKIRVRVGVSWIPLDYVHQLQHALRLCGLNELADNIKID